jgi:hypothetical protein
LKGIARWQIFTAAEDDLTTVHKGKSEGWCIPRITFRCKLRKRGVSSCARNGKRWFTASHLTYHTHACTRGSACCNGFAPHICLSRVL